MLLTACDWFEMILFGAKLVEFSETLQEQKNIFCACSNNGAKEDIGKSICCQDAIGKE